ncbi:unnamed protein product, partial [Allacma fusca]
KKSIDDDSNNDSSCYRSLSPLTQSAPPCKPLNGSKLDGEEKVNSSTSCPSTEYSQIRIPDSKNIVALSTKNSRHRKEAGIPVGIAVAWQRLVTSASTSPTTTNSTTMSCPGRAESPSLLKPSKVKGNLPSPTMPKRPSSTNSAPGSITSKEKGKNNHSRISELKCRPASVNLPIHNPGTQSKSALADQQYSYGGLNSQYADWPAGLNVPHLSP